MAYRNTLHDLDIPRELIRELLAAEKSLQAWNEEIIALTDPAAAEQAFTALAQKLGEDALAMLGCYLKAAELARENYRKKGVSEEIYLATMHCFARFLGETLRRTGKLEFDRGFWTWRQTSGLLYRVEVLEFELLNKEKAISVHIPSDSDMTPGKVSASIKAGREFMTRYFPESSDWPMVCDSWLLCQNIGSLLPEGSNILSFQRRFRILEKQESKDCYEWLFAVSEDTALEDLPEHTSLQRSVKAHLLSGGKVGTAMGVLIEE